MPSVQQKTTYFKYQLKDLNSISFKDFEYYGMIERSIIEAPEKYHCKVKVNCAFDIIERWENHVEKIFIEQLREIKIYNDDTFRLFEYYGVYLWSQFQEALQKCKKEDLIHEINRISQGQEETKGLTKYDLSINYLKFWWVPFIKKWKALFNELKEQNSPAPKNKKLIGDNECPINYLTIEENDKYLCCNTCHHNFLPEITVDFIKQHKKCPYCKSQFNKIEIFINA